MAGETRTLTIGLSTREQFNERAKRAFKGETLGHFRTFATPELLWRVLTTKREEIIQAMMGQGPMSIRAVARRVKRDIKAVHGDVRALIAAHIVVETEDGRVDLPYDEVRVTYVLIPSKEHAAA
jgi:predicted transcriptional regulator